MRTILPLIAALTLAACSDEPEMVAADPPSEAVSAAIGDIVRDGDPYAATPSPAQRRAPQAPPSSL